MVDTGRQLALGAGQALRVRAIRRGFYCNAQKRIGDVFDLIHASHLSTKWMEPVAPTTPLRMTTAQEDLDLLSEERLGLRRRARPPTQSRRALTMDAPLSNDTET